MLVRTLQVKLYSSILTNFGTATLRYTTVYDKETNSTTVFIGSVLCQSVNMLAKITAVYASVRFADFDNEENFVIASANMTGLSSSAVMVSPTPKTFVIEHDRENPNKKMSVSVSVTLVFDDRTGSHYAQGSASGTIEVGTASIFRVGEENGELYVYSNGKWRVGYLHCADEKKWIIGVGHIILRTDNLSVSHDGNGNVVVNGLEHSHDGNGNVVLTNVTAGYDESGSVTLY